ncbi:unnamed protein product [Orchesella dallaii]|uniref:Uncharacterized protein n=1 Tax=Orchesella dallaii TaxID=48710 RepID=A0ABP1R909_9HEXA
MAKTTKAKINDKTLDVLQKTKKQSKGTTSSKKTEEVTSRSSRSRSRSMSRTPARPPPAKTKKVAKKKERSPDSNSERDYMVIVPQKKKPGRKAAEEKAPKEPKATKPRAPRKPKVDKPEPKRVGKEPTSKPRKPRASTPTKQRVRQTPTRQSKRLSIVYNSNPSNSMDTLDSPKGSNHILNSSSKDVDSESISSTSSRRGWFSNCVIV